MIGGFQHEAESHFIVITSSVQSGWHFRVMQLPLRHGWLARRRVVMAGPEPRSAAEPAIVGRQPERGQVADFDARQAGESDGALGRGRRQNIV